jgi:predicted ATPase
MIHLRAIAKKQLAKKSESFPFNLPIVKSFKEINFHSPVTFFVAENGSGKSTFLEVIAAGVGSITVGGEDIQRDNNVRLCQRIIYTIKICLAKKD